VAFISGGCKGLRKRRKKSLVKQQRTTNITARNLAKIAHFERRISVGILSAWLTGFLMRQRLKPPAAEKTSPLKGLFFLNPFSGFGLS
jgi:hypothetical protein